MARRKRSLSSSDSSSSSSSSQSDSSSPDSDSVVEQGKKNTKEENSVKKDGRDESRSKVKDKVDEKAKKLPQARSPARRRKISDHKSSKSESGSRRKSDKSNADDKSSTTKHNKSPERPHRQRPKRERSPKVEKKKKMLFPIVSKEDNISISIEQETGKKHIVTETTLVSYPNLNSSINVDSNKRLRGEEDRKRRHTSPERFKSMSSMITVKYNPEVEKRPRRSPVARISVPRSLRDRVGWDPFQGTTATKYGDHDDRQLNRGYNDSYTRKDFGRGRGRGRGAPRAAMRSDMRQQRTGRLWTNNRNFSRNNEEAVDRSGINDKKWKRDLFSDQ